MKVFTQSSALWIGILALLLGAGQVANVQAQERAVLEGIVTDAQDQSPLVGANVVLRGQGESEIIGGTATGTDGRYRIANLAPGEYVVEVRYVGFREVQRPVTLVAGEVRTLDIALEQADFGLETIVVSASRRPEKVQDAPASISVLTPEEIELSVTPSSVDVLRNTPGVDLAQTGIDQQEVVLRGFNNAFSGATYVLTDYRQAAVPSLGVNVYSLMPNQSIDLERVEVVRGPGSALYGAGVDRGVIHFITKDPFNHPGTTLALTGGQRSFFSGQLRHAGVVGERVGYKITGHYAQGEEWRLDSDDEHDADQLADDFVYEDPSQAPANQNVGPGGRLLRDDNYQSLNINGFLQYRFGEAAALSGNVGYSSINATTLSGIGTLQADGFGYTYGQLRLRAGDFFAQAYVNRNDAGDSYVYGTGNVVVDNGMLYNAQAQYDFRLAPWQRLIAGLDAELTRPDTEGTILGRNEDDDTISEYGAYAQSTTNLGAKLDLTTALRADYNNVVDEVQLSPRVALVYRATPQHTLRISYNRSFSSPGTNSNFLDIEAQRRSLGGGFDLVFQARGAAEGFSFNNFRERGTAAFLLPVPGFFGTNQNVNALPLVPIYGAAAGGGLVELLASGAPLPDPIPPLSDQQRGLLANLLGYTAQTGALGTATTGAVQLGIPDDSERGFRAVAGPADVAPLDQTTTQTFEVGYKGLIGERVLLSVDGYYEQQQDFIGAALVESPLAYLQQAGLSQDVGAALGTLFATTSDPTVQDLLQQLQQAGLPPDQVAALLAGLVGGALANTPAAVVQPDQPVLPTDNQNEVGALISYRNFGTVTYYGVDVALEVRATDRLRLFGNASFVSDDFFDNEELDEENADLALALNAPKTKAKGGFSYSVPRGLSFNASARYTEGFPVLSGPYVGGLPAPYGTGEGGVEDHFLLDVGVGYDFEKYVPGLRLNVTVQNALDNEHRQFIGATQLGRLALARLTYSL